MKDRSGCAHGKAAPFQWMKRVNGQLRLNGVFWVNTPIITASEREGAKIAFADLSDNESLAERAAADMPALRQLDGSKNLVVALAEGWAPPIVLRAIEDRIASADEAALVRLRAALDHLAGRCGATRDDG